jgi:hypothetical protein
MAQGWVAAVHHTRRSPRAGKVSWQLKPRPVPAVLLETIVALDRSRQDEMDDSDRFVLPLASFLVRHQSDRLPPAHTANRLAESDTMAETAVKETPGSRELAP